MNTKPPLYLRLAQDLEAQIQKGVFQLGDPVPSVRALSRQRRVSVSTVLQAYFWLENRGWIEARPKSGFYVRTPLREAIPEPQYAAAKPKPMAVGTAALIAEVIRAGTDQSKVPFGAACASAGMMPNQKLSLILRSIVRNNPDHSSRYPPPNGVEELRREIAKRSYEAGCSFASDDVLVTSGAMEALHLALRVVAEPGGIIATESPTYFGIVQAVELLGMKAIEIPTHPRNGIDLNILEDVIRKHRVRACTLMTNCHNPLGTVMPDDKKKALVDLVTRHNVPLIEDDVYGDLTFHGPRARTAKSFDREGLVLLCGSFSKTIAPGLRVGWLHGGRYGNDVERLKMLTTIASPALPQLAVAKFLESGGYDRHLRRLRTVLAHQVDVFSQAIARYFPESTRISRPDGGYVLWVELPKTINSIELHRQALDAGISISPGPIFSAKGNFTNFIRINCGTAWSERLDRGLIKLGKLCERLLH